MATQPRWGANMDVIAVAVGPARRRSAETEEAP
jgi:hypothetical protein